MSIYQMFSKGVRLLALHIEYQQIGNAKIQNEMSNRSPMNSRAKQIGKSPVWQFLFNGTMHKSSFTIQGIWRDTWKCTQWIRCHYRPELDESLTKSTTHSEKAKKSKKIHIFTMQNFKILPLWAFLNAFLAFFWPKNSFWGPILVPEVALGASLYWKVVSEFWFGHPKCHFWYPQNS